jgi:hypothetical protein
MFRVKTLIVIVPVCLALSVAGWSQSPAAAGFDKLKTLAGEWQGTSSGNTPVRVSYQLTSGGSALMETIRAGNEGEMLTVYHRDGDSLLMTHYCMAQNQPRMRARPKTAEIRELEFDFVDVSNLSKPDAGHMRGLLLTFEDANHITAKWTWKEKGQEKEDTFRLTRQP